MNTTDTSTPATTSAGAAALRSDAAVFASAGVWYPVEHLTAAELLPDPAELLGQVERWFALSGCAQDPSHHGEGDVFTHTEMVLERAATVDSVTLARLAGLAGAASGVCPVELVDAGVVGRLLSVAAVLHDVAKPVCTRVEDGRIVAPRHGPVGARMARRLLFEAGVSPAARETICALVAHHTAPPHLVSLPTTSLAELRAAKASLVVPWPWLSALSRCDVCGRVCDDQSQLVDAVELSDEWVAASPPGVSGRFATAQSRLRFFDGGSSIRAEVPYYPSGELIVMSGLPGSGKSSWLAENASDAKVVSLDAIRAELGVAHGAAEGEVVARARSRLRELLRGGGRVAFDATNLRADGRRRIVELGRAYRFEVTVVAVEAPRQVCVARDAARRRPVGAKVIDEMSGRWEFPTPVEAHRLVVVDG